MTYLVEINDKTNTGRKALNYLQKLQLLGPAIRITQKKGAFRKLTAEEMVFQVVKNLQMNNWMSFWTEKIPESLLHWHR